MSSATTTRRTASCPSWCVDHIEPDDIVMMAGDIGIKWGGDTPQHNGPDVTGESVGQGWTVGTAQDGTAPAVVDAHHDGEMTPAQARAFAAAIIAACETVEAIQ